MDFFASQEAARRSSRSLLLLFFAAIAGIVVLANLTIYFILKFQSLGTYQYDESLMWKVTGAVLLLVISGSVYRIYSLKKGGAAIAASLGGRLVGDGGADELERRLINVVEEMSIASGLPVPAVYLIDADGINAFAAGFNSNDAIIGITRGALYVLNRDELQGVIAHEFSHILHGDMTLNMRLVGILYGILMLSHAGRLMLETRTGVARKSSGAFPVLFLGLSMFLIGYVGKFFGDLIKAGVSRQREYLADASAVQYTRHSAGIAGALKRIGGYMTGSSVRRAGADEFSHLYFSSISKTRTKMFATHPPLAERIARLEPNWDGQYLESEPPPSTASIDEELMAGAEGFVAATDLDGLEDYAADDFASVGADADADAEAEGSYTAGIAATDISEAVGSIEKIEVAAQILSAIPATLRVAVHESYSVRAVVYGLFLHSDPSRRAAQADVLKQDSDVFVRARLRELNDEIRGLSKDQRLPILELALPAIKQLSDSEYARLEKNVDALLEAAQPINLSDWALSYYLKHHMQPGVRYKTGRHKVPKLRREIQYLLSVLAHSDSFRHQSAEHAFDSGIEMFDDVMTLQPPEAISIAKLEQAVTNLNKLHPLQKPRVLKAFVATISADGVLSAVEIMLVRCFADAIDCPLPPLGEALP